MKISEKEKYSEQYDELSSFFRERFYDHQVIPDQNYWKEIEQHIVPRKGKKKKYILLAISAISAVILLITLFLPEYNDSLINNSITNNVSVEAIDTYQTIKIDESISDSVSFADKPNYKQEVNIKTEKSILKKKNNPKSITSQTLRTNLTQIKKQDQEFIQVEESNYLPDKLSDKEVGKTKKEKPNKIQDLNHYTANLEKETIILTPRVYNNEKDKWLLSTVVGSGSSSFIENYTPSGNSDKRIANLKSDYSELNSSFIPNEEFTKKEHSVPISFGLTIRRNINKHFGVETGLVYTYLSSKLSKENTLVYKAKQELHYLGIPVNAIVYLKNTPKLDIYLYAGGMVEKGLRAKYVQDIIHPYYDKNTSTTMDINGLQWSLNSSMGISYNFYQKFGVYVEPKFSHYFKNNQPMSIRTEKDFVFSINTGFKYEF